MSHLVWQRMFCLVMHVHQHNYYNADIITNNSVGKLQLGIFDSAFFAENVIKQIIHRYYYITCLGSLPKPFELFLHECVERIGE